jgi:PAS domain S-box-containing protein
MKKYFQSNPVVALFFVLSVIVLVVAVCTSVMINSIAEFLRDNIEARLLATSHAAAQITTAEELAALWEPADMDTPAYADIKARLITFAEDSQVLYAYYMRETSDGLIQFIVDNDTTEDTVNLSTPPISMEESPRLALNGTAASAGLGNYSIGYDGLLSAFAPVFDAEGHVTAIVGVDMVDEDVLLVRYQLRTLIIALLVAMCALISSGGLSFFLYRRKEDTLSRRLKQQELMSELSQGFIAAESMSTLIHGALRTTGEFLGVTRLQIAAAGPAGAGINSTLYAWRRSGYPACSPVTADSEERIMVDFPSVLSSGELIFPVCCDDIDADPKYAGLKNRDVKSAVWAPLYVSGAHWATLCIEECLKKRRWSTSDLQLISLVSSVIAGAIAWSSTEQNLLRMSAIVENSPLLICHVDQNGALQYANEAASALFGFSHAEIMDRGLDIFFDEETTAYLHDHYLPLAQSGGKHEFILPMHDHQGTVHIMSIFMFPVSGRGGIGLIGRDDTEKMQMERDRLDALEQAYRASKAKSDFLANMSHEMRTPMNAIIGMTSIAQNASGIERKDDCLKKIEEASVHLLGVINDILDMSKIEANKFDLSSTEFNFEDMLRKVTNVIGFRIEEKQQKFTVRIDNALPRTLVGDDLRLAQVITNLLSNAVKFTPEHGSIWLRSRLIKEEAGVCTIQIEVADTGIGISPEQQSRLFSSFVQAESGTARKFGGTGLGLAISKRIVEMMNGRIWIESTLGQGALFACTVQVERGTAEPPDLLAPGVNRATCRMLAVDDESEIREYFIDIAHLLDVSCDMAASGAEAMQMIEQKPPYAIYFIDWSMPGVSGAELPRRLKAREPKKPVVIMLSSKEWSLIEDEDKNAGADTFLFKPIFPSAVAACVNECLNAGQAFSSDGSDGTNAFAGYRVLLAEDVEINREIVLALLEPTGLVIDCAVNGLEALQQFSASYEPYDMIFMDIQMPDMDGYEATRRIRALETPPVHIPIIAMTANVFREDIEKCLAAGMDDHLGKPLDFNDVLSKLRKYLPPKKSV